MLHRFAARFGCLIGALSSVAIATADVFEPELVVDFNPGPADGVDLEISPFSHSDSGEVLWRGSGAGNVRWMLGSFGEPGLYRRLSDGLSTPDTTGNRPLLAASWNDDVVFQRRPSPFGTFELYKTSLAGPIALTPPLMQCSAVISGGTHNVWMLYDDHLFFIAQHNWLWKADGASGTAIPVASLLRPGNPPDQCLSLTGGAALSEGLVFAVRELHPSSNVAHVFSSDGTPQGTFFLRTLPFGATFHPSAVYGDRYYFNDANEIWSADGASGELILERTLPGMSSSQDLRFYRSQWWIRGRIATLPFDSVLYRFQSMSHPLVAVVEAPGTGSYLRDYQFVGDRVFVRTDLAGPSQSLWVASTHSGTATLLATFGGLFATEQLHRTAVIGPRLYFLADTDEYGVELWRSDGTPDGTEIVVDSVPGPADGPQSLAASGSRILFNPTRPDVGRELFSIDTGYRAADMNCNGSLSVNDIGPFVLALTDRAAYEVAYPGCDYLHADLTLDGVVSVGDIAPFVAALIAD